MLPTSLKAGTVFSQDYEILNRLAQGGMGTVYVAMQLSTGKKRALKIMHAQYEGDDQARKRFIQEARAGASIDSDHIVEMVSAGIDPETNTPWIAMELLSGQDLKGVLAERGRLPSNEVLEIFRQLCHALGKAHKMGLVHRDMKPENIFLAAPRREGVLFTVKILDFGIAKLVRENTGTSTQTQAIGSPRWMSPEQADRGGPISPSTDVWALGLIAFNLLTGNVYWKTAHSENPSVIGQMCEILMDPLEPPSSRAASYGVPELIPAGFDAWFERCVNRDVGARYADADEALAGLEEVLDDGTPLALPPRSLRANTPAPLSRQLSSSQAPATRSSMRPDAAKSGYSLDITSSKGEQPFSLDATRLADSGRAPEPTPLPEPLPVDESEPQRPWTRRVGPVLLAILGPVGIAAAIFAGLHSSGQTGPSVPPAADASAALTPPPPPPPPVVEDAAVAAVIHDAAVEVHPDVTQAPPVIPQAHVDVPQARTDSRSRAPRNVADADTADPTESSSTEAYTSRVLTQLRGHYPEFVRCYEQHGTAAAGSTARVSLHFSIGSDGHPTAVGTSGLSNAPEVGDCISAIVRGMSLPTPVVVSGPIFHELRFQSAQAEPEAPASPPPAAAPTAAPAAAPTAPTP